MGEIDMLSERIRHFAYEVEYEIVWYIIYYPRAWREIGGINGMWKGLTKEFLHVDIQTPNLTSKESIFCWSLVFLMFAQAYQDSEYPDLWMNITYDISPDLAENHVWQHLIMQRNNYNFRAWGDVRINSMNPINNFTRVLPSGEVGWMTINACSNADAGKCLDVWQPLDWSENLDGYMVGMRKQGQ